MSRPKTCNHTILDNNCDACKTLKERWYKKAEKSGFEDIESDEENLKAWSADLYSDKARFQNGGFEAKQQYYIMAGHFLNEYAFKNKKERTIWEKHADGWSNAKVAVYVAKFRYKKKVSKQSVQAIVARLKEEMLRMYMTPENGSKNEH